MTTYNSIVHHRGGIHGEHASHKRSHMDNKIDDGFRIHGKEKVVETFPTVCRTFSSPKYFGSIPDF